MAARRQATYEDVLAAPDHLIAEIVDGELITSPRPRPRHATTIGALHHAIYGPFDGGRSGPGGWRILFEPEIHLGADVVVPDLAGWRRERLPELPAGPWFSLAPDWVCEVLSPSTVSFDRGKKLAIYAREGVDYAWLVDPAARTVEVLRRDGVGWIPVATVAGDQFLTAQPFDSIAIDLPLLWDNRR